MKTNRIPSIVIVLFFLALTCLRATATVYIKANNENALNLANSWNAGPPGSGDTATFDGTVAAANNSANIGANVNWGTLSVSANLAAPYTITGTANLDIFTTVTMANNANAFNISCPVVMNGGETWTIGANDKLTLNSTIGNSQTLNLAGGGTIIFNGASTFSGGQITAGNMAIGPTGSFTCTGNMTSARRELAA